ncbi:MAG: sodium-dependent bicarbonate transport family permease [Neobacillus sp.]
MAEIISNNLLSPAILFFVLGLLAATVKSDLKFPKGLSESLSIYLLVAIGLKGGIELSHHAGHDLLKPIIGALFLGTFIPVMTIIVCRLVKLDVKNSVALGATYGSVSIVTFAAAISFLGMANIEYESFMTAIVVLLESPAIIVSLILFHWLQLEKVPANTLGIVPASMNFHGLINMHIIKESLFGKSILLLTGSLAIGYFVGHNGIPIIKPLFIDLYQSILVIFLLGMGLTAGERLSEVRKYGWKLIGLAIIFPVFFGIVGLLIGKLADLSLGGLFLMGILAASSSYIAAPAAIKSAVPGANPSIYLGLSLGITFPFNLTIGLPLYFEMAKIIF